MKSGSWEVVEVTRELPRSIYAFNYCFVDEAANFHQ
jgi:hypothetical protein